MISNWWIDIFHIKFSISMEIASFLSKKYKGRDRASIKIREIREIRVEGETLLKKFIAAGELDEDCFYGNLMIAIKTNEANKVESFVVGVF
jgi:hypothetical protein